MRKPEEYAADYPDDPAKALAARLIDLEDELRFDLIDVSVEEEARELRMEYYLEVNRAWMDGK